MAELISRERAYGLAYKAGAFHLNDSFVMDETVLLAFVKACVKLARNAGLEEAAQKCRAATASIWDYHDDGRKEIGTTVCNNLAIAIESLKDNTP